MGYYEGMYKSYHKNYILKGNNPLKDYNGISHDSYNDIRGKVTIINEYILHSGTIIDLGCGNGLLLRMVVQLSKYQIVPFGVDFLLESILYAKNNIIPQYKHNFICSNIIDIDFQQLDYDYIVFDPESFQEGDDKIYFSNIYKNINLGGKIFIFLTKDSLRRVKSRSFLKQLTFDSHGGIIYTIVEKIETK